MWKYFEHHGNQRLVHINYFSVLSSAILLAQYSALSLTKEYFYVSLILGIVECVIAFVFWKIDERTVFFIKHVEGAIKALESRYQFSEDERYNDVFKVFINEEQKTKQIRVVKTLSFKRQISHRKAYRILLISFSIIAIIGSAIAVLKMV